MTHRHHFLATQQEGTDRQRGFYTEIMCTRLGCGEVRRMYWAAGSLKAEVVVIQEGTQDEDELE